MMSRRISPLAAGVLAFFFAAHDAYAACVNKFLARTEGARQVVTLLTGKLTFQEAQTVVAAISNHTAPPFEWVDEKGHILAKQFGDLKLVRPMPVGCDGKPSGVVLIATFVSTQTPTRKMLVKLDANTTVAFEQSE